MPRSETIERAPSSLGPTARSLPIALLRAREAVMEPVREMLGRSHISEQKWRVLRVLEESGPLEQTAISEQACLSLPSLTRILRAMQEDKLVIRHTDKLDRRKSIVSITPAGLSIIDEHAEESFRLFRRLEKEFGKRDMDMLLDLLEKLQTKHH